MPRTLNYTRILGGTESGLILYWPLDEGINVKSYAFDLENLPNGINDVTTDDTDNSDWWTLQGLKIGRKPTQPGVYIHQGNKITIRRQK